ncbi:MAG: hypothetical protein GY863_17680 [bacterium]|nr:hypothetical protein [bacterium]
MENTALKKVDRTIVCPDCDSGNIETSELDKIDISNAVQIIRIMAGTYSCFIC